MCNVCPGCMPGNPGNYSGGLIAQRQPTMRNCFPYIYFVLLLICNTFCKTLLAQEDIAFAVTMKDSIIADRNADFLYNNISVINKGNQHLLLKNQLEAPEGWKLMAPAQTLNIELPPGGQQLVPVVLMKLHHAAAGWLPVVMKLSIQGLKPAVYRFYVKANPVCSFRITPLKELIQLQGNNDAIKIPVRIKNTGTVSSLYTAGFRNNRLEVNHAVTIRLKPGTDTIYTFALRLGEQVWRQLRRERISIDITDTTGVSYQQHTDLERIQHTLKERPSPYQVFPLYVESGSMQWGDQFSYFGAARGELMLGRNRLGFFYRSKQYGLGNTLEQNIFGVSYQTKKWDIYAGHLSGIRYFFTYGNGFRINYRPAGKTEISLSAVKHNRISIYKNNNVTGSIRYPLKQMSVLHAVSVDIDRAKKYNGYLLYNEVQVFSKEKISLQVNAGIGKVQSTSKRLPLREERPGGAWGYVFGYRGKHLELSSFVQYNSQFYPGLNKGLIIHMHDVNWKFGSNVVGIFYQYNHSDVTTLRDTIYNTDALKFDMARYGVRYSRNGKGTCSVSGGIMKQSQGFSGSMPEYAFMELLLKMNAGKIFSLMINATGGYNNAYGTDRKQVLVTNTNISLSRGNMGIKGYFMQMPVFDIMGHRNFLRYNQTLLVGPFAGFSFLKHIRANVYYNFSKSLYDNSISNRVGCNVSYSHPRNGLTLNCTAVLPLQSSGPAPNGLNERYVNVSVNKRFNIPLFFRKKYSTLNLISFSDVNGNGIKEPSEKPIGDLQVDINNIPFITDEKGNISYKNISQGEYQLDFRRISNIRGLVPAAGLSQRIQVKNDITVMLPFRKSRVISGNVTVSADSLGKSQFSRGNIKVTASDSSGLIYSTLTNDTGDYFLNVPAGKYVVSLNPQAFDGKIKPRQMSYVADVNRDTTVVINFEVIDKSRRIRFFNSNAK
ncbi:MAG TPA: carboxypeptidase-like regulatory domain-containing protein [Chitinophaga sp.]|uniref:carboxypeptidase-like regulatory domain-containing protein n=1 Tax=Chitinophaga sp. TaxID=1869181 RepID=UPI002CC17061|nr:carboxypeptidase-like regulatory domain-containing protein [Chitinophaga sp.]HVI46113.1 carboxypeptidase-like regulatory domain-containing protein [Chitinophaga sp.]